MVKKKKIDEALYQVDLPQEKISVNKTIDEQTGLNESVRTNNELINVFREYRDSLDLNYQYVRGRTDLIMKYRSISLFPEVARAIDKITTSAIVKLNGKAFEINVSDTLTNNEVREIFLNDFESFLIAQNVNRTIYEIFEKWYVDSCLYVWRRRDPETKKLDYYTIDPTQLELIGRYWTIHIQSVGSQSPISMLFQASMQYTAFNSETLTITVPFEDIKVYYSGKYHNNVPIGYLHKALKPANQLNLLKDALLVYRLSRSAEKLVFYIDVGDMKKEKAEAYINGVANKYRNNSFYNGSTGDIDSKSAIQSFLKTYFIGRQTNRTTEITTVGGNINLGDVEDFKLFLNELYYSLDVPRSRMAMIGEENSSIPLFNNAQELQLQEKDFFKFLNRVRDNFQPLYIDMYIDHLVEIGRGSYEDLIKYKDFLSLKFYNDLEIEKLILYAELTQMLEMLGKFKEYMAVDSMPFFSTKYITRMLLGRSDKEQIIMMKEIKEDMESSFYGSGKIDPDLTLPPEPPVITPLNKFDMFTANANKRGTGEYLRGFTY